MGGTTSVDGGEMAVTADRLGEAARGVCDARDLVLTAWRGEWSIPPGELHDVFVDFCRTWLTGLDAVARYVQFSAEYTQAVANAYCAVDQELALKYLPLHSRDELPEGYPVGPVPASDPNAA